GVREAGHGTRETIRGRVVVGADGLRSVVARRLGGRRTGWPRRVAFTAHVAGVADVGEVGEMHVGRRGYVGLGPVGGGVTTIALVVPATGGLLPHAGAGAWRREGARGRGPPSPRTRARGAGRSWASGRWSGSSASVSGGRR